ncbi:MAG: alanine racemase [bacterium]
MMTWVNVKKNAIKFNLRQLRKQIGNECLLMPVIKANAYGHGLIEMAKICDTDNNVDRLCVVNSDEALRLIENKIKKPIQVLSYFSSNEQTIRKLAKNGIILPLYSLNYAHLLNRIAKKFRKKISVHIKIDIGTSRIGVLPEQLISFCEIVVKLKNLNIEGIFAHFSSSEESREVTKEQLHLFLTLISTLEEKKIYFQIKHISCSAATILYKKTHLSGVRTGLSLYGLYPSPITKKKIILKPALSWHTKIIQIKKVPTGAKIGYDQTFTTQRPTKLAILPVGYWDGLDRSISNKGCVLIKGTRCPILGRICMNMTIVDATRVCDLSIKDLVTLIGKQKKECITIEEMAGWANTINYEIIDRINPLIPRIYG